MKTAYSIHNWSLHFETPESLKRVRAGSWVPIPNKHEGRGYRRIMSEADGRTIYGTWIALVQSASKVPVRGLLADHDGPICAEDLATKIMATKEEVEHAIAVVTSPRIGWMDEVEWDEDSSFNENISRLASLRQITSFPVRRDGNPSGVTDNRKAKGRPDDNSSSVEASQQPIERDGNPSGVTDSRQACEESRLQDSTGQNSTKQDRTLPPAVPQGGPSAGKFSGNAQSSDKGVTISISGLAKKLICEKILGGKDPSRPWSYQADAGLSRLLPLPIEEIEDIAWFRSLPKTDDIPELKARRDPITETTLMDYWGDELLRARDYRKKTAPAAKKVRQPEPPNWEAFFRWKYSENCRLPTSFWELGEDQRDEWHRDHEEFDRRPREQSAAVA